MVIYSILQHNRFHTTNIGRLAKLSTMPDFVPCTPKGVLELIRSTGIEIEGKTAVVVGRSDVVVSTSPVVFLFSRE